MDVSLKTKIQDFLFFILILLNTFVNLIGGTTGGNDFFFGSLVILIMYGTTIGFKFKINYIVRIYSVIVFFSFLSLTYAKGTEFVLEDLPRVLSNFFIIIIASTFLINKRRLIKALKYFVTCALFLAIPNLIFMEIGVREMYWGGVNPVGAVMLFAIMFTTMLAFLKRKIFLFLIPFFISTILITQSQKIIGSLVVIYGLLFLYNLFYKSLKQKKQYLLGGIISVISIFLLINNTSLGESFLRTEATMQQMQTGEVVAGSAVGSGFRSFLIDKGVGFFIDKPFFGYGLNQSRRLFLENIGRATYTHNTFVELLISFGLFVTLLYAMIYFLLLKKIFLIVKSNKNTFFAFLLFSVIGILIVGYFQKMYYDVYTHLFLLISLFLIKHKSNIINEN